MPERTVSQHLGKTVILECLVNGIFDVYFLFRGREMRDDRRRSLGNSMGSHTLRIANLTEADYGEYVCESVNELGRDRKSMQLLRLDSK